MDSLPNLLREFKRAAQARDSESLEAICYDLAFSDCIPENTGTDLYAVACDAVIEVLKLDSVCRMESVSDILFVIQFLLLGNLDEQRTQQLIDCLVESSGRLSTPESLVLSLEQIILLDLGPNAFGNLDRVAGIPSTQAVPFIPNALKKLISESSDIALCEKALSILEQMTTHPDLEVQREAGRYWTSAKEVLKAKQAGSARN